MGFPLHRDMSMMNTVSNVETGVSKVEYNHGVSFASRYVHDEYCI